MKGRLRARWKALAVCAAAALVLLGNRGFRRLASNWSERARLRREAAALEKESRDIQGRIDALKRGDAALERAARRELGYMKPGEVEYRFTPPGGASTGTAAVPSTPR